MRIVPLLFPILTSALATFACAVPPLDEPPLIVTDAPESSGRPSGSAAPSGSGSSAPAPSASAAPADAGLDAADAGPAAHRWRGTLATTAAVPFGGGAECQYRITLRTLNVDIASAAGGEIFAATVKASAFEEVLTPGCPNAPIAEHVHTYVLAQSRLLSDGKTRLELAPLSSNRPLASLVVEGDLSGPSASLTLLWHRTDYGPPLDWRVAATVAVSE